MSLEISRTRYAPTAVEDFDSTLKTASVGHTGQKMPDYELAPSMRALVVLFQDELSAIEADAKLSSSQRVFKTQDVFHKVQNGALQIRDAEWEACDTHTAALDVECRAALPKADPVTSADVVKAWDDLDPVEHMVVWPQLDDVSKAIVGACQELRFSCWRGMISSSSAPKARRV